MIIVDLLGGLGNQLFQYAAGRYLAELHQVDFKINTLKFETYKLHKYSLQHFNISASVATKEEVQHFGSLAFKIWERAIFKPYYKRRTFQEQFFHFDENFKKASKNTMLSGYWQSEKYFNEISDIIRKEFTITSPMAEMNKDYSKNILRRNSVSLHIRRGDYVSDPKTQTVHGSCDLAYYNACVKKIAGAVGDPFFYIFSDDPEWVKSNFSLKYPSEYVVHNNADKNYEDLRLMSLCKHNIIANSSFSWWGAWLNANPDKQVYAPKQWFNNSSRNTKDIIPVTWEKI